MTGRGDEGLRVTDRSPSHISASRERLMFPRSRPNDDDGTFAPHRQVSVQFSINRPGARRQRRLHLFGSTPHIHRVNPSTSFSGSHRRHADVAFTCAATEAVSKCRTHRRAIELATIASISAVGPVLGGVRKLAARPRSASEHCVRTRISEAGTFPPALRQCGPDALRRQRGTRVLHFT